MDGYNVIFNIIYISPRFHQLNGLIPKVRILIFDISLKDL